MQGGQPVGVGVDRQPGGLGQGAHLAGLAEAPHPADVELDHVEGLGLDDLGEPVAGGLVLARGDRHRRIPPQRGVVPELVGHQGLLHPLHVELAQGPAHPPGVLQVPAHVGVGHDVDAVAHRGAQHLHQGHIAAQALGPVGRAVQEAHLHGLEPPPHVLGRLLDELVLVGEVEVAGVDRDLVPGPAAQQLEHRLAEVLAGQVPQGDVDRADREQGRALAPVGQGAAEHLVPEPGPVERVGPDQQPAQVLLDDDAGGPGVVLAPARADQPAVGFDLHHAHGVGREPARQRMAVFGVDRHRRHQPELVLAAGEVAPERHVDVGDLHPGDPHGLAVLSSAPPPLGPARAARPWRFIGSPLLLVPSWAQAAASAGRGAARAGSSRICSHTWPQDRRSSPAEAAWSSSI